MALLLLLSEESVKEHWQLRKLLSYFVCCSALLRVGMGKLEGRMARKESCVLRKNCNTKFSISQDEPSSTFKSKVCWKVLNFTFF